MDNLRTLGNLGQLDLERNIKVLMENRTADIDVLLDKL